MSGNSDTCLPSAVLERASLVLSTLEATGRLTFMQGNLAGGQRHSMRITTKTIPGQHLWSDSRHRARSSSRMSAARSSSDGNCLHHAQCANAFGAVNRSVDRETVMRGIA